VPSATACLQVCVLPCVLHAAVGTVLRLPTLHQMGVVAAADQQFGCFAVWLLGAESGRLPGLHHLQPTCMYACTLQPRVVMCSVLCAVCQSVGEWGEVHVGSTYAAQVPGGEGFHPTMAAYWGMPKPGTWSKRARTLHRVLTRSEHAACMRACVLHGMCVLV
jgi:hypothetical protein